MLIIFLRQIHLYKNCTFKVSLFLCSYSFINHLNLKKKCKRPEYNDEGIVLTKTAFTYLTLIESVETFPVPVEWSNHTPSAGHIPPAKRSASNTAPSTSRKQRANGAAVYKQEVTFRPNTTSDETPRGSCILKFIYFISIFD